jgi:hypothetical protein
MRRPYNWDYPEIDDWDEEARDERQLFIGAGFGGGFGCRPRFGFGGFGCRPRFGFGFGGFGCRPRFGFGFGFCYPRQFFCFPRQGCFPRRPCYPF